MNPSSSSLTDYLRTVLELIERRLTILFPEEDLSYRELQAAARYSLLGGGKRIRPLLALTTYRVFTDPHPDRRDEGMTLALSAACALELIHTYSLIHDDLPCMDDDDFRRGKPSLHKHTTEGLAVLTGDYLLTSAFEILSQDPLLTPTQKVKLITTLAQASGGHGMVAGQVLDIAAEGKSITLDQLRDIHNRKTGALITASLELGAILADVSEELMIPIRAFGQTIGLAFQVIDDLLDVVASPEKHGKSRSSDAANNKTTYVTILGIEKTKEYAEELHRSAMHILQQLPVDTTLLEQLAPYILNRRF